MSTAGAGMGPCLGQGELPFSGCTGDWGTGWRRAWEPGHEGQVGGTVRSWGAEEGLLGAFLVGPGDWLRAREDSQRFTGTKGLRSFEGILPAHALLAHRPTSPGRACPLLPENAQRTSCSLISQCLEEGACRDEDTGLPQEGVAFWDGAGFGVYWLRPPKMPLLPPFFRGEIKAPNGEVFSQGPTTIWRQAISSSLLFSFPAHVFCFLFFFCYLTYVSCPRSQETLLCVITGLAGQPTWVQSPVLLPPGCVIQQGSLSVLEPSSLPGKQD